MNFAGGATSAPSAAFNCQSLPSQETAYTVYLPGPMFPMTGTASWPPGQSVPPLRPLPSGAHVLSKCFFQSCAPVSASRAKISSEIPATIRISFFPPVVSTPVAISGGNGLCISRGTRSSLVFQRSVILRTLSTVKDLSALSHPVRPLSAPSIRYSALQETAHPVRTPQNSISLIVLILNFILWPKRDRQRSWIVSLS